MNEFPSTKCTLDDNSPVAKYTITEREEFLIQRKPNYQIVLNGKLKFPRVRIQRVNLQTRDETHTDTENGHCRTHSTIYNKI